VSSYNVAISLLICRAHAYDLVKPKRKKRVLNGSFIFRAFVNWCDDLLPSRILVNIW
jgi:hypothetical protein